MCRRFVRERFGRPDAPGIPFAFRKKDMYVFYDEIVCITGVVGFAGGRRSGGMLPRGMLPAAAGVLQA
jgi:hypothetical protein